MFGVPRAAENAHFLNSVLEMLMSTVTPILSQAPDYTAIKGKQQATWATGDYAVVGATLQLVGESLAEAADIRAGERVLDVAAGNGNPTLAAARRFADVTSTDYVETLLRKGAERARAEGWNVAFQTADAEALPFADRSFDAVLSTFGVMFTPDHRKAAREMLRVARSGGRIGLANWTPTGFVGQVFKLLGAHVPSPAGLQSPALWGTETYIAELFGQQASDIRVVRKTFVFRYRSAAHWLQIFRDYYGPMNRAFAALDAAGGRQLEKDIFALLDRLNEGGSASLVVPSEYLEVVIVKE